jgi:uncharacterized protein YkuJ
MTSSFFCSRGTSRSFVSVLRILGIVILMTGLVIVFSGCGAKAGLVGKWHSQETGETLEFTAEGKIIVTADYQEGSLELTYTADGANVTFSVDGTELATVPWSIDGDVLTTADPDAGESVTYDRVK